jgi:hypothetical protein
MLKSWSPIGGILHVGQHKHNPTVQLAKEGKLPPKKPKMGKRECERTVMDHINQLLYPSFLRSPRW